MKNEIHVSLLESVLNRIDEISAKTLGSYIKKASDDHGSAARLSVATGKEGSALGNAPSSAAYHSKIAAKRKAGIERATDKLTKKVNEEQQIDEISSRLAGEYSRKAYGEQAKHAALAKHHERQAIEATANGDHKSAAEHNEKAAHHKQKLDKRTGGVFRAYDKAQRGHDHVNEEEQLDEISKHLAQRYWKRTSGQDYVDHNEYMSPKTSDERRKVLDRKFNNRDKGMAHAEKILTKEEALDEQKVVLHHKNYSGNVSRIVVNSHEGRHFVVAKSQSGADMHLSNYTPQRHGEGTREAGKRLETALIAAHKTGNKHKVLAAAKEHGYHPSNWSLAEAVHEEVIEEGTIGDIVKLHKPIEGHHYGRVTGVAPGSIKVKIKKTPNEKEDDYHYTSDKLYSHVKHGQYRRVDEEALNEGPSGIKPEGEKAFAGRHKIEIVDLGVSNEVQHTAHDIGKDKSKKASYEDGEDTEAYFGKTSIKSIDLGIKGKLKEAADDSKYHADAAERHQKAAEAARADGKKMLAKQHEKQAARHREIYKKHQQLKEQNLLDEARFDHRDAGAQGVVHPDSAKYMRAGEHADFYDHGTGDKKYGRVMKNDGKQVHIQHDGKLKKYRVATSYPSMVKEEQLEEATKDQAKAKEALASHMKLLDRISDEGGRPTPADMAKLHKLRTAAGHKPKAVNEESNSFVGVIAEISSKVLGNYIDKASEHLDKERQKHGYYDAKTDADRNSAINRHFHANKKRIRALHKATLKFVSKRKEEKAKG